MPNLNIPTHSMHCRP